MAARPRLPGLRDRTMTIDSGTVLLIRPLSVVAQGDDFLVGDPDRNNFIVLPEIGVRVIDLLRSGRPLGEVATAAAERAGTEVDVVDFARSLCDLGFASIADDPSNPDARVVAQPRRPRWAPLLLGPPAWTVAGLALVACVLIIAARPQLFPTYDDAFFLSNPVRSLVALTLITFAVNWAHEMFHWAAARAEGLAARVSIDRRLYMLVFETDLTGLWSLPRRRRYWPLLIGIGFDTVILAIALAAQYAAALGWWRPDPFVAGLLAAVALGQFADIVAQCFIFLRTDIYAVFAVATGCFNLWQVTRLVLRQRLRLARPAHLAELAAAHPRDRAVANWFVWAYGIGMLVAVWFFVAFAAPALVLLVKWLSATVLAADPGTLVFWEATGFGLIILSPYLLTLWVLARDGLRALKRAAAH